MGETLTKRRLTIAVEGIRSHVGRRGAEIMTDESLEGLAITFAEATASLNLAYPDGSVVRLTMPKPAGLEGQTREQSELLVRRLARRLLLVAAEDLSSTP